MRCERCSSNAKPPKGSKPFESIWIRSLWDEREQRWYFSVVDVVVALTDSPNPKDYWYRIKQREKISEIQLSTICRRFKLAAPEWKLKLPATAMLRVMRKPC
jgi:DNA-damage-inducible protein D